MSRAKILELRLKPLIASMLILIAIAPARSQEINSLNWLEFRYGFHSPSGDMKDRFGANTDFGAGFEMARFKSKIFIGADGAFIFSSNVKEDVVKGLRSFDGSIIGRNGQPANVSLKERGFYLGLNAGKIFSTTSHEKNITGIRAQVGAGLLQHKIRVQDNSRNVIALEREKLKGYDRMSNGPAVHLGLGFQYQNPKNNFHFNIMGDFYAARTQSRRDFDNPTGGYLAEKRTDILAGMTLAYVVVISRTSPPEKIYY